MECVRYRYHACKEETYFAWTRRQSIIVKYDRLSNRLRLCTVFRKELSCTVVCEPCLLHAQECWEASQADKKGSQRDLTDDDAGWSSGLDPFSLLSSLTRSRKTLLCLDGSLWRPWAVTKKKGFMEHTQIITPVEQKENDYFCPGRGLQDIGKFG